MYHLVSDNVSAELKAKFHEGYKEEQRHYAKLDRDAHSRQVRKEAMIDILSNVLDQIRNWEELDALGLVIRKTLHAVRTQR